MKLSLDFREGVQVLSVSGNLSERDSSVLAAGIIKFLRDGKDRVLVDFQKANGVKVELLNSLSRLNQTAKELGGEIVLCGLDPQSQLKLDRFPATRAITSYPGVDTALIGISGLEPEDFESDDDSDFDAREIQGLRAEIENLRRVNSNLERALQSIVEFRRKPRDIQAYQKKIALLEEEVLNLAQRRANKS